MSKRKHVETRISIRVNRIDCDVRVDDVRANSLSFDWKDFSDNLYEHESVKTFCLLWNEIFGEVLGDNPCWDWFGFDDVSELTRFMD